MPHVLLAGLVGFMELTYGHRDLPSSLDTSDRGLYLAATNLSDNVFMYLKREVSGLTPNRTYEVTFRLEVASNAPTGCAGIGGAPGEAVVMKVGVATVEPVLKAVPGSTTTRSRSPSTRSERP